MILYSEKSSKHVSSTPQSGYQYATFKDTQLLIPKPSVHFVQSCPYLVRSRITVQVQQKRDETI